MPVGQYIGGVERTILHHLYALLHPGAARHIGKLDVAEPFAGLFTQGMVTRTPYYRMEEHDGLGGRPIPSLQISRRGNTAYLTETGTDVIVGRISVEVENTVDPTEIVDQYGADATLDSCSPTARPSAILSGARAASGAWRFVNRLWRLFESLSDGEASAGGTKELDKRLHHTIAGVAEDVETLAFNKSVAKLYELVGAIERNLRRPERGDPYACTHRRADGATHHSETWAAMGNPGLTAVDPALLVDDEVTIAVQVNGKLRDTLLMPKGRGQGCDRSRGAPATRSFDRSAGNRGR